MPGCGCPVQKFASTDGGFGVARFFIGKRLRFHPPWVVFPSGFEEGLQCQLVSWSVAHCEDQDDLHQKSIFNQEDCSGCIDFQQMPHASSQVTAPWQMIQELKGAFWSHVVRTDLTATVLEHRFVFIEEADDLFSQCSRILALFWIFGSRDSQAYHQSGMFHAPPNTCCSDRFSCHGCNCM